jgi:hypothetical protein
VRFTVRVADPCLNVTVPVGVPPLVAVTVAVSVTDCSYTEGFEEDVRVVVVLIVAWARLANNAKHISSGEANTTLG